MREDQVRKYLTQALSSDGFEVAAKDPADCIRALMETSYRLILIDRDQEGDEAFALLDALRTREIRTPCLILTYFPVENFNLPPQDELRTQVLAKPFDLTELRKAIQHLLSDVRG